MAKRFALSFGLDALKNREAITALHRDGVLFATNPLENPNDPTGPPPNLAILEILAEFTNKLLKQDKRMVLQFLDRILTMGMPSSRGEEWQPLLLYRNSLVHGESDLPPQTARRAYGRRRNNAGNWPCNNSRYSSFICYHQGPMLFIFPIVAPVDTNWRSAET